jgi:hypothetical protein
MVLDSPSDIDIIPSDEIISDSFVLMTRSSPTSKASSFLSFEYFHPFSVVHNYLVPALVVPHFQLVRVLSAPLPNPI